MFCPNSDQAGSVLDAVDSALDAVDQLSASRTGRHSEYRQPMTPLTEKVGELETCNSGDESHNRLGKFSHDIPSESFLFTQIGSRFGKNKRCKCS